MSVFDRQIATATRLIKKYGQSVTWRSLPDGTVTDPDKPWRPVNGGHVDHSPIICFLPDDRENRQFYAYLTGKEVSSGTTLGYMAAVNFEPKLKDIVIRDGVEYQIQNINLLSPNGENILYTIEFKT